jgi:peptidoglycan hydrolase-like protein with peptidoglycan-binding domain
MMLHCGKSHGPKAAVSAGSPGHETTTFGAKIFQALKKFQQAHNLPATGYLGPLTRTIISQLP